MIIFTVLNIIPLVRKIILLRTPPSPLIPSELVLPILIFVFGKMIILSTLVYLTTSRVQMVSRTFVSTSPDMSLKMFTMI